MSGAYRHARSLADTGRYDDAERTLRSGLARHPADADLLALLGFVLRMRQDYPAALRACEAAVEAAPGLARAHAERAENLLALIRHRDAIAAATEATRLAPRDPAGHLVLARALAGARDFDRARAVARHGLSLDPGSVDGLLTVATIERDAGHREAAMAVARDALTREPGNAYGRWLVAMLDAENLRVRRTMRALRAVARDNPARPDVISTTWPVGRVLSTLRRWFAAVVVLVAAGTPAAVRWDTVALVTRLLAIVLVLLVLGFAARVMIPAGRQPWRCLRLAPRLLRRGVTAGLVAVGAMIALLVGYAATGRWILPVLALAVVPVLWAAGFAELLGARPGHPGFRHAVRELFSRLHDIGGEMRNWWRATRRELRESWTEPSADKSERR